MLEWSVFRLERNPLTKFFLTALHFPFPLSHPEEKLLRSNGRKREAALRCFASERADDRKLVREEQDDHDDQGDVDAAFQPVHCVTPFFTVSGSRAGSPTSPLPRQGASFGDSSGT
jgi:hypothetical protein